MLIPVLVGFLVLIMLRGILRFCSASWSVIAVRSSSCDSDKLTGHCSSSIVGKKQIERSGALVEVDVEQISLKFVFP